jgi:hypothetical protein
MPKKFDPSNQARRDTVAEIIAALMWEPKTVDQIVEITGCAVSSARGWINAFHDSGLVRISARLPREKFEGAQQYGRRRILWAWQAKPFDQEDAAS